jgi:hypothetical protein
MPVILVKQGGGQEKSNPKKMEGRGGGEAQGAADQKRLWYYLYLDFLAKKTEPGRSHKFVKKSPKMKANPIFVLINA